MSQRNPMNDRYQTDEHRGQTRKSAATMKPKTKAASSVRIQPTVKTKQQKKADKKAARAKQTEIDRQYYNPPTPEYKRLRKIWWGLLIGAIVMTAMSWFGRASCRGGNLCGAGPGLCVHHRRLIRGLLENPQGATRLSGRDDVQKTKEMRAAEKQQKAAQRAAKQKVEELRPWRRRLRSAACSATGSACRRSRSRADGGENFRQGFDEVRWGPWFLVSTWRRSPASTGGEAAERGAAQLLASARLRISAW